MYWSAPVRRPGIWGVRRVSASFVPPFKGGLFISKGGCPFRATCAAGRFHPRALIAMPAGSFLYSFSLFLESPALVTKSASNPHEC